MNKRALALAALLMVPLAAFAANPNESAAVPRDSAAGRYQIVINPQVRVDTFLLDTQTGRVWVMAKFSDLNGEPTAWEPMTRLDSDAEMLAWIRTTGLKPTALAPKFDPSTARPVVQPQKHN